MTFTTALTQNPARGNTLLGEFPTGEAPEQSKELNSFTFEDFENHPNDEFPILKNNSEGIFRLFFQKDAGGGGERPGTASIEAGSALFGNKGCQIVIDNGSAPGGIGNGNVGETGGSLFLSLYNNLYSGVNNYRNISEVTPGYQQKTYNRMRFWIKMPSSAIYATTPIGQGGFYETNEGYPDGGTNFHVGAYLRRPEETTKQETDNFKLYHYYNMGYVNNWQAVEVDFRPSAQRSDNGGDLGNWEYPMKHVEDYTGDTEAQNYFDQMVYFYITDRWGVTNYPSTFHIDGIELYTVDFVNEDLHNANCMTGARVLIPGRENEIHLQWKRSETDAKATTLFDVKYAFTSFYDVADFDAHGVVAPNRLNGLSSQGMWGYNSGGDCTIHYQTDLIPLAGKDVLYIAVRKVGETEKFRQCRIPLTPAGYPQIGA